MFHREIMARKRYFLMFSVQDHKLLVGQKKNPIGNGGKQNIKG